MTQRRTWIKLYVDQTLRGTCFSELNEAERFIWFGFLLLAGDSAWPGVICATEGTGYSDEQLAELLKTSAGLVKVAKKKMIKFEKITVDASGKIGILNWHKYQSEYQRQRDWQKEYAQRKAKDLQRPLTTASDTKRREDKIREEEKNNIIKSQPSATSVENLGDNFQESCPIKNHTQGFASTLFAKIREAQGKGVGKDEGEQYLKACLFSCVLVRKRWFYAGCTEDHFKACEKFIGLCVEHLKDQVADKSRRIRWGPAYLAAIIEEEINNYGENYFKSLGLAHDRKLAEKVERK